MIDLNSNRYIANYIDDNFKDITTVFNYTTIDEIFDKVLTFTKFISDIFNISIEEVKDIILNKLNISIFMFIEYSLYKTSNSILICDKAFYKIRYKEYNKIKEYYDVYLIQSPYTDRYISDIIKYILNHKYPEIFENPIFNNIIPIYNSDVLFNIPENLSLSDLSIYLRYNNDDIYSYTIKDLIDAYNKTSNINDTKLDSKFHIYYSNSYTHEIHIYLIVDKDKNYSLRIPLDAFLLKDWSLIENEKCYNVGRKDIGFYSGLQKNAPFMDYPIIKELRKYFN